MPSLVAPDGLPLHYEAVETQSPRAAILVFHGWSDHAGRWSDLAERLRSEGFAVYALDWRGHGQSSGRRGHLSRFSQLLGDLQAFRRVVRKRTDAPQVLLGQSFGGRSEEHTSELQSQSNLVCRLLLEKKKQLDQIMLGA